MKSKINPLQPSKKEERIVKIIGEKLWNSLSDTDKKFMLETEGSIDFGYKVDLNPSKEEPESKEDDLEKRVIEFITTAEGNSMMAYMYTKSEREIVDFIRSEKKKSAEEGQALASNILGKFYRRLITDRYERAINKRNKEIATFIEQIKWDGRLSQGQIIDNILEFINKN